jgi:hypothetical protein
MFLYIVIVWTYYAVVSKALRPLPLVIYLKIKFYEYTPILFQKYQ